MCLASIPQSPPPIQYSVLWGGVIRERRTFWHFFLYKNDVPVTTMWPCDHVTLGCGVDYVGVLYAITRDIGLCYREAEMCKSNKLLNGWSSRNCRRVHDSSEWTGLTSHLFAHFVRSASPPLKTHFYPAATKRSSCELRWSVGQACRNHWWLRSI